MQRVIIKCSELNGKRKHEGGKGPHGKKGFHGSVKRIVMRIVGGTIKVHYICVKLSKNRSVSRECPQGHSISHHHPEIHLGAIVSVHQPTKGHMEDRTKNSHDTG